MGHTLSGYTVLFGTSNAVQKYNVFGHPTAILGKSPSGLPYPINVDASGDIIISGTGGGGGIPVTPPTWVRHSALLSASAQAIPAGAIYQYSVLTGTAGDGTMTGLPAGYSDSSQTAIATGFTITAAAASTVAVVWFTPT